MACHNRSTSLPSTPHSCVLRVEEDLQTLKARLDSSLTMEISCDALKDIGHLYECIEEIFCLPGNQNCLSHPQQKKWVEEELEGSVRLLDLCKTMQDNLGEMKMSIQDIQLALRRGGDAAAESKVKAYIRLARKANKTIKEQAGNKSVPTIANKDDTNRLVALMLLIEAKEFTMSLLQSVFSLVSKQIIKPKTSRCSLVPRTFHKRKVACEEQEDNDWKALKAQKQLQTLELSIEGLENGLECLFKQLIRSRVSLLNILSS